MQRWTSVELQSLRDEFSVGNKPKVCQRCWHEEDNHKSSLRLRLYDFVAGTSDYSVINKSSIVQDMVEGLGSKKYLQGPKILSIKNGNICNAKCRTCHPGDSSRWISDADRLFTMLGTQHYRTDVSERNWTDEEIEEIYEISKNLVRLELFGGEPLYNKKVVALLNRIIDSGHSKQLNLYINTNGSVDLLEKIPNIHKFKEIEIGVSIDGLDQRFNYIRHGIEFQKVIDNITKWQQHLRNKDAKFYIDCITTVNVLNILDLPDIKKTILTILPNAPFWNLLINPDHLFIKNMPDTLKQVAISKLSIDPEFLDLINVIKQPADPAAWDRFLAITSSLDSIRQENFAQVFPELDGLIDFPCKSQ